MARACCRLIAAVAVLFSASARAQAPAAPPAASPSPSAPAPGAPPAAYPQAYPYAQPQAAPPGQAGVVFTPPGTITGPYRAHYRMAGAVELGWNTLAGLGGNFIVNVHPHLAIDAGLGLSALGWKTGLRLRANLLETPTTPFLAAGIVLGAGTLGQEVELESDGNEIKYKIQASPYAQIVGGVEVLGSSGWMFTLTAGWASLLRDGNVVITAGVPDDTQRDVLRLLYDSGLVLGVSIGRAFR